jgi:hypothetical protein
LPTAFKNASSQTEPLSRNTYIRYLLINRNNFVILLLVSILIRIIFIFHINQPFRVFKINHFFSTICFCKDLRKMLEGVKILKPHH